MRRAGLPIRSIDCAQRHRAFAAALCSRRTAGTGTAPVAQVLLRRPQPGHVSTRVWMPMHFALQLIRHHLTLTAAGRAQHAGATQAPVSHTVRERLQRWMREVAGSVRVLQERYTAMPVSVAPAQFSMQPDTPAPSARTLVLQRAERQALFPRVAQVVVRAASPAPARAETSITSPSHVDPPRAVRHPSPWPGAPAAPAPLPSGELARVTEHVIRQLDRRALSYHERMGTR